MKIVFIYNCLSIESTLPEFYLLYMLKFTSGYKNYVVIKLVVIEIMIKIKVK